MAKTKPATHLKEAESLLDFVSTKSEMGFDALEAIVDKIRALFEAGGTPATPGSELDRRIHTMRRDAHARFAERDIADLETTHICWSARSIAGSVQKIRAHHAAVDASPADPAAPPDPARGRRFEAAVRRAHAHSAQIWLDRLEKHLKHHLEDLTTRTAEVRDHLTQAGQPVMEGSPMDLRLKKIHSAAAHLTSDLEARRALAWVTSMPDAFAALVPVDKLASVVREKFVACGTPILPGSPQDLALRHLCARGADEPEDADMPARPRMG